MKKTQKEKVKKLFMNYKNYNRLKRLNLMLRSFIKREKWR